MSQRPRRSVRPPERLREDDDTPLESRSVTTENGDELFAVQDTPDSQITEESLQNVANLPFYVGVDQSPQAHCNNCTGDEFVKHLHTKL